MLLDILLPGTLFFKLEMFSVTILWLNLYLKFSIVAPVLIRVAPDIISGPGQNPAKFSYPGPRPDMVTGYEVGFDHLLMHLPHCVIGQEIIVLQIR